MNEYNHLGIEKKWQNYWDENKTFRAVMDDRKKKYYVLDMFPYPSGAGLHVGHPEGYTATDIISRLKRRQGYNVLHPMGWDAFGLPAENYAIKTGTHPRISTDKNIETFKRQIKELGLSYDWDREVDTTDPKYFKWSQWIFLQLFKKGLAYEKEMPMNWCPACKIVAANEEVEGGVHERCGYLVEKRRMKQWMLKITEYADRLLNDLDNLNWSKSIKEMQRNWIGKSNGLIFTAPVKDINLEVKTFSAHFEACYADTFVVIAPDHPFLGELLEGTDTKNEVMNFCNKLVKKRMERGFDEEKESEGIFTGRYIVDPLGNGDLPIWVASYALADYGTGIVKCSCHDERDFDFAKKYNISLKPVLFPDDEEERKKVENLDYCYIDMNNGVLSEPIEFKGQKSGEVRAGIIKHCEENGFAVKKTSYKLRDWIFTRQRYWGEPIPLVHCEKCGVQPIPESELPLELPKVEKYEPMETGESPLAMVSDWVNTTCPKCKGKAKRETSTMPNWAGSSWYWLRYMDPKNDEELVSKESEKYWGQVDLYVGGAEHAVLHLLYARFWHKFLYDIGIVTTIEPFQKLVNQGMILAFSYKNKNGKYYHPEDTEEKNGKFYARENGEELSRQIEKMSKSKSNVVNPDDVVKEYGADTLRLYEMFMGPFDQTVVWDIQGVIGMRRFLEKIWRLQEKVDFGNKKAIIIHGWEGSPDGNWFPLLKEKLIEKGYYVQTPSMPSPDKPKYEEWKKVIDSLDIDENTILIGHSLGGGFIPRYLSDIERKIDKAFIVSPTSYKFNIALDIEERKRLNDTVDKDFGKEFNIEKVNKCTNEIFLFYSDNDEYVPLEYFEDYIKKLLPKTCLIKGGNHLQGDEVVPRVLENFSEKSKITDLERLVHKTIKKVSSDTEEFKFNTAISAMMVLVNEMFKCDKVPANFYEDLLLLINPYAPHITEELWSFLGHVSSLSYKPWPKYNEELCEDESIIIAVQVNGKVRAEFQVPADSSKEDILKKAKDLEGVKKYLNGNLVKEIYVPGKLVSLVVKE